MTKIKILIVDDHTVVAESLAIMLSRSEDMKVLGNVKNGKEVLLFLEQNAVDIVLTDMQMPEMNGILLTSLIKEQCPQVRILILTMIEEVGTIQKAIKAGVNGYLFKSASRFEVLEGIRAVAGGLQHYSKDVLLKLNQSPHLTHEETKPIPLTRRELEILRLIVSEYENQEIANRLFVSLSTIETHRRNIMRKLGVNSALGLAKYAIRHKIVEN